MKFRTGFVSNSSSTSWIVAIPKNFFPSRKQILAATGESVVGKVLEAISALKSGIDVYECDDYGLYSSLSHILREANFDIAGIDGDSERGVIHNVLGCQQSINRLKELIQENEK